MSFCLWSGRISGRTYALICPLLLAVVVCGCNKTRPATSGDDIENTSAADSKDGKKQIIPVRRNVTELDGNWVMVVTVQGKDNFLWIMRMTKGSDGKTECKILDYSNDELAPEIESSEVKDKSVYLKIKNKRATVEYRGQFDGVAIRGTLSNGPQEIYIGRFLPTDAGSLDGYVNSALPPASDIFQKAINGMKNQPQPKVILQLAREHKTSPIALEAVFGLLNLHARAGFDDATVLEIVDLYIELAKVWGPQMTAQAELIVAQQLVTSGRLPIETLKHLDEYDKLLGEQDESLKQTARAIREQAEIQAALAKSRSKSDEDKQAAYADLQQGLKKQPFNAEVLQALAEYSVATKQVDAAIEYYSTIVALPLLEQLILAKRVGQPAGDPTPSDVLKNLWIEKHGNEDGLQPALTQIYKDRLQALRDDIKKAIPAPPEEPGDHQVLIEFFTGGQMPPAIATEIATEALRETYPDSKVITLRYHQHIPGPDGLVNQDSEDRFAFYEMARVPGLAIDGAVLDPDKTAVGGFLQHSGNVYAVLRLIADSRLKQTTPVRIELDAKIENGELAISANVTGVTEEALPSLRLRLALAEEEVSAKLPNGIRTHAMVVREMPGGARGIAPKKGELKFVYTMPASDLQQHLDEYLKVYESGKKIDIPPDAKPPVRGPLHLVAWVQNDKVDAQHPEIGRGILQTAIVRISGELPAPPAQEPATKEPEAKESKTKDKVTTDSGTPPEPKLPE